MLSCNIAPIIIVSHPTMKSSFWCATMVTASTKLISVWFG